MIEHDDEGADDPVELARRALDSIVASDPTRHAVIIGLVAPLGTQLAVVQDALAGSLDRFGYRTEVVHLSALLDDLPLSITRKLPARGERDYYEARMNAGDELRRRVGSGSALAVCAVERIAEVREGQPEGVAFILRSLKHSEEHALLRQVYGEAFSLLAVSSTLEDRREHLVESLAPFEEADARAEAEALISRDEADVVDHRHGQQVRKVFELADAYVPVVRGVDPKPEIDRFVDSLFGQPFLTPRPAEEAMKLAHDASLRSAALGRQVGAALVPPIGTPVVVGTNEVPKPGGGQYWAGDIPDLRDYQSGVDPNPQYMRRAIQELFERLIENGWLAERLRVMSVSDLWELANEPDENGGTVLSHSRLAALIEFNRCVHAEQSAILNAARSGTATQGSTLYTTTFPCHECTKMIVGAGVVEVVYIEPYPKSLASKLFRDIINTSPSLAGEAWKDGEPVAFRPYQGIAPRRYEMAFRAPTRKVGEVAVSIDRQSAPNATAWREVAVRFQENKAMKSLEVILEHEAQVSVEDFDQSAAEEAGEVVSEPSTLPEASGEIS